MDISRPATAQSQAPPRPIPGTIDRRKLQERPRLLKEISLDGSDLPEKSTFRPSGEARKLTQRH
jgi:hypothetical protein